MRKILVIISLLYVTPICTQTNTGVSPAKVTYEVNLLNYQDDLFHVTVYTAGLSAKNNIYNLPATVPGTYTRLDCGRFVKTFEAFDNNGNQLQVNHIGTNQWEIENADKLAKILYDVEDSFDSEIKEHRILPMLGTGINDDFILLNTYGVLGYFEGLQSIPVKLKLDYKSDWTIGTSLTIDEQGYYTAETYDHLADSPILMGELSTATTYVNDIKVGVYVYSSDTLTNAAGIMKMADEVLQSSSGFIGYSPVSRYNFLMCLLDEQTFNSMGFIGAGALEHSYSSLFVRPAFGQYVSEIKDEIAHEFLHILTPLNLHSQILEPFNFEVPTASQHIWLYEGVTEWASDIMQLRSGLITIDEYLDKFSEKLSISDRFRQDLSLTRMSTEVYSEVITMEFINFYNKGAVTAALLDLRLLELSNGTRGLREVFLELLEKYGKHNPFPEDEFFEIFVQMTYPEIEQFINDYIINAKTLPYVDYMAKLGYSYIEERPSENKRPALGIQPGINDKQQLTVAGIGNAANENGFQNGDVLLKIFGEDINIETIRELFGRLGSMNVGDPVNLVVERGGEKVEITVALKQRMDKHIFKEMDELTDGQKFLRDVWTRNL